MFEVHATLDVAMHVGIVERPWTFIIETLNRSLSSTLHAPPCRCAAELTNTFHFRPGVGEGNGEGGGTAESGAGWGCIGALKQKLSTAHCKPCLDYEGSGLGNGSFRNREAGEQRRRAGGNGEQGGWVCIGPTDPTHQSGSFRNKDGGGGARWAGAGVGLQRGVRLNCSLDVGGGNGEATANGESGGGWSCIWSPYLSTTHCRPWREAGWDNGESSGREQEGRGGKRRRAGQR